MAYNEALEQGAGICEDGRGRAEQGRSKNGFFGTPRLPDDGRDDAKNTNSHGRNYLAALPLELDASPGDAHEKAGHACREEDGANPVDASQLGHERRLLGLEFDIYGHEDESHNAKWELWPVLVDSASASNKQQGGWLSRTLM